MFYDHDSCSQEPRPKQYMCFNCVYISRYFNEMQTVSDNKSFHTQEKQLLKQSEKVFGLTATLFHY